MHETSLAPGLLLAMPQLLDPNFVRSVVLMIEHGDRGSFGLIVNQPSPIKATELLESLSLPWGGDPDALVWSGGPVARTTGWVLHEPLQIERGSGPVFPGAGRPGTAAVGPGLALSTSTERLRDIATSPPGRIRLLLGYAGWGPGQLAAEMARGSWIHAEADPALIFEAPPDEMWSRALRSLGVTNPESLVPSLGVH
jgi:putative transcriptional regulator